MVAIIARNDPVAMIVTCPCVQNQVLTYDCHDRIWL